MTNKEKIIEGMKLIREGCDNILMCNSADCPLYPFCNGTPPCYWTIEKEDKKED